MKINGTPTHQRGIGLLEVMIGVLVFVGGALAITNMQKQAIRTTHDLIQRSQAIWLASAAVDMIKANQNGLDGSLYQNHAQNVSANPVGYCTASRSHCIGSTCSTSQMAQFDVEDLICTNDISLINPNLTIDCRAPCSVGARVVVTVSWDSRGATGSVGSARQQVEMRFTRH